MGTHGKGKLVLTSNSSTPAYLNWHGGRCMLIANATWGGGNIKLQTPGPDASGTATDIANSTLSANGTLNLDLPPGQYKVVITTATAVYASLIHIP